MLTTCSYLSEGVKKYTDELSHIIQNQFHNMNIILNQKFFFIRMLEKINYFLRRGDGVGKFRENS